MLLVFISFAFSSPQTHSTKNGYVMNLIPSGRFMMGSKSSEKKRGKDEQEHEVVLNHAFYIGKYEVSQQLWEKYLDNKSRFRSPNNPVNNITFFDALTFANMVSTAHGLEQCYTITPQAAEWPKGLQCKGYRLPTEAEWEYAARAGQGELQQQDLDKYSWNKGNSGKELHPVGTKNPNGFGLYDTLGNVWEWVWDIYADYPKTEVIDPIGAKKGQFRVRRGGGYSTGASRIRIADRYALNPINKHSFLGMRLVRTAH